MKWNLIQVQTYYICAQRSSEKICNSYLIKPGKKYTQWSSRNMDATQYTFFKVLDVRNILWKRGHIIDMHIYNSDGAELNQTNVGRKFKGPEIGEYLF